MKLQRTITICLLTGLFLCTANAQGNYPPAPNPYRKDSTATKSSFFESRFYRMTHIAIPLIAIGSIANLKDQDFREMRNTYAPRFKSHYDDYLQYSPGVLMLGLKAAGVEGRSSWGRMLASDAIAAGIMAITVNSLKASVRRQRPDQSSYNSFPSGHTATAFMLATMLHKEYGLTRSPIYSIAGYSLATATALSRQLNNRHWFSDVLTGAGIGILSTELGYYFADLIFKDKGLIRHPRKGAPQSERYSFFGLQMGYGVGEREVHLPQGIELEGQGGVLTSLNGGWLFSPHWGITGKLTLGQTNAQLDYDKFFNQHSTQNPEIQGIDNRAITYTSLMAGIMYDYEIAYGLHLGGSIMPGIGWTETFSINAYYRGDEESTPLIRCRTHPMPNLDFSAYMLHSMENNLGLKLFVNYNMGRGKGDYTYYTRTQEQLIPSSGRQTFSLHNFSIGAEIDVLLWK